MQVIILPLIGLLLFFLDTLINSVMPITLGFPFYFTSHLVLLYLLIIAVYKNPTVALILGVLFGIISDVYLSTVYGIYTFSYIAFIMMMDQLFKVFYKDIVVMIGLLISFVMLFEAVQYVLHRLLSDTSRGVFSFLFFHGLPSSLLNFILLIIIFPLILRTLERSYK